MLLDVGCATGDFLTVARNLGYLVEGLELSKWSSEIARKKGIRVYQKSLKELSDKLPGRYDIITLWGVAEHFEHPLEEISYIKKLLNSLDLMKLSSFINSRASKILSSAICASSYSFFSLYSFYNA